MAARVIVPVAACVLGLLAYALSSNPKACELGRLSFAAGLFWALAVVARESLQLP